MSSRGDPDGRGLALAGGCVFVFACCICNFLIPWPIVALAHLGTFLSLPAFSASSFGGLFMIYPTLFEDFVHFGVFIIIGIPATGCWSGLEGGGVPLQRRTHGFGVGGLSECRLGV